MSFENWERKVLSDAGAAQRVADIESELRSTVDRFSLPGETIVPAEYFDSLLADLDRTDGESVPALVRAARRMKARRRTAPG